MIHFLILATDKRPGFPVGWSLAGWFLAQSRSNICSVVKQNRIIILLYQNKIWGFTIWLTIMVIKLKSYQKKNVI